MADETLQKGDWIVHKQHGVGQIKEIEKKTIGGKIQDYFRVKVSGGVYWLPTSKIPDYVRSVSSRYKFRKTFKLIRKTPEALPRDYKERDKLIAVRLADATLEAKGELIRDLFARRHDDQLNMSALNEKQLAELRKQFVREMVVVLGIEVQEAEKRLEKALQASLLKARDE
ncbi:MAG: hypothetical protein B5M51_00920 [Anaerolinea sp. 4484_236]|nr:MAG: hypothetical protein B5M51_00920 [Anaerolinea sp. 4484_236]OQY36285.1 MAG: hypothetical protein B6243_03620 [Anaerolineaceae bacterium 4572_5.2]